MDGKTLFKSKCERISDQRANEQGEIQVIKTAESGILKFIGEEDGIKVWKFDDTWKHHIIEEVKQNRVLFGKKWENGKLLIVGLHFFLTKSDLNNYIDKLRVASQQVKEFCDEINEKKLDELRETRNYKNKFENTPKYPQINTWNFTNNDGRTSFDFGSISGRTSSEYYEFFKNNINNKPPPFWRDFAKVQGSRSKKNNISERIETPANSPHSIQGDVPRRNATKKSKSYFDFDDKRWDNLD